MPKISYQSFNFRENTLRIIVQANQIIDEYLAQGFGLTLRQLYYQFVARDLLANTERNYKRLGSIVNDGRLAGLIDWDAITDRTRNIKSNNHWDSPSDIIKASANQYKIDKWQNQQFRIEVWIEKDALVDVIARPCRRLDVYWFSCRGYVSQSEMWRAAQRLRRWEDNGQTTYILHLGDHDPSGIDMTQDIRDRLQLFGAQTRVLRIALTMEQIRKQNPPPNPAKMTDARFESYQQRYGNQSWELDALEPSFLVNLVEGMVDDFRDVEAWEEMEERESSERSALRRAADRIRREL
jgi:hypothetical protein